MMLKMFYSISMLNNKPSVYQWRLRMTTQFPSLTHWSKKILEDTSRQVFTGKPLTLINTCLMTQTTLHQLNAVLSSAYTIDQKINIITNLVMIFFL